ncbi:hypothetical protein [Halomonas sp. BC04]|uniref:hypothetical protein n=1 Tax=Halomonas sp. BC04 TaxID=1403540 RepID=UPI0003ED6C4D|nr:hypothetical protein [Halomonas sp. BC04]EWH00462.1 hypothetical protein Q427_19360 [Halomonas sp. BC04]
MSYSLDTASHISADRNRVVIRGSYLFTKQVSGLSKQQRIQLMHEAKDRIRRRDAEPAAWFYHPTRTDWVKARYYRGEFDGQPHEVLGRAFTGEEVAA